MSCLRISSEHWAMAGNSSKYEASISKRGKLLGKLMLKDAFAESTIKILCLRMLILMNMRHTRMPSENSPHFLEAVCKMKRLHSTLKNGSPDQLELEIGLNIVAYYPSANGGAVQHGILSRVLVVSN